MSTRESEIGVRARNSAVNRVLPGMLSGLAPVIWQYGVEGIYGPGRSRNLGRGGQEGGALAQRRRRLVVRDQVSIPPKHVHTTHTTEDSNIIEWEIAYRYHLTADFVREKGPYDE